ncbi:voltage-gated potassium channel [Aureococcus anophagefferens]|nr:voltage-gated potassium channel [Aureococcus anophagefferens]
MDVLVSPATLVVRSVDQGAAALESLAARGEALDAKALRKTANRLEALCAKAEAESRGGGSFAALGKSSENEPSEDSAADKRSLLSRGNSHHGLAPLPGDKVQEAASGEALNGDAQLLAPGATESRGRRDTTESVRFSLESKLCLFNTELATHARRMSAAIPVVAPTSSFWMINPQGAFRIIWDIITALFRFTSRSGSPTGSATCRRTRSCRSRTASGRRLDGFFVLDLAVNLKTGFVTSDGEVVMGAKRAATHYLCSWFPIDFVSSMPPLLKIGRVFKIFKVFRIAKILKISSDSQIGELIDDFLMSSASKTAMKLINIVGFTAIFAHFLSCFAPAAA